MSYDGARAARLSPPTVCAPSHQPAYLSHYPTLRPAQPRVRGWSPAAAAAAAITALLKSPDHQALRLRRGCGFGKPGSSQQVSPGAREGACNSSISRNHVSPHSGVERLPLKMPSRGQKRRAAAAADGGARPAATPLRVGSSSRTNAGVPAPPAPRRRPRGAAHDPRLNVALALRGVTR